MLNIAVIDDEAAERKAMEELVFSWSRHSSLHTTVQSFPSAESFLFEFEENKNFDVLLLDVEMGKMNGVELAHVLRDRNFSGAIVFITGYPDFMADGFDVSALHYLLKPVNKEKLFEVLSRAAVQNATKPPNIVFLADGESISLSAEKILYAESRGHYMHIFTKIGEYRARMTVSATENLFGTGFVRIGRAFVVNLEHVLQIGKTQLTLTDGTELPVPRGAYNDLNMSLLTYTRER